MCAEWKETGGTHVCLKRIMSINIKHLEHFPSFLQEDLTGSTNSLQTQLVLTALLTCCPWLFNQFLKTKRNTPLVTLERQIIYYTLFNIQILFSPQFSSSLLFITFSEWCLQTPHWTKILLANICCSVTPLLNGLHISALFHAHFWSITSFSLPNHYSQSYIFYKSRS